MSKVLGFVQQFVGFRENQLGRERCNLMPIVVTILIATFNHEKYIGEAIDSVLMNTLDMVEHGLDINLEIIVMDDGSRDCTSQVVNNYSCGDLTNVRIIYVYQDHDGQASAYQNALEYVSGEYIFLLDSDDRFVKSKIRKVIDVFLNNKDVGLVGHPLAVIDADGYRTGEIRPKIAKISHGDVSSYIRKNGRNVAPPTSGLAFTKTVFRNIHPSPLCGLPSAADAYLSMSASLITKVYALEIPLAEYRQHNGSQYLRRLTSIEGLTRTVETQRRILVHLNLLETMKNNSYFMRHKLVLVKMEAPGSDYVIELFHLIVAIIKDPFLGYKNKILFIAFWTIISALPKNVFWKMWIYFQVRHSGNKSMVVSSNNSQ